MLVAHLMTSINVLTFQKSECDHEYEELWKESGIRKSCSALLIMWITNTYKKRDCYDQFQLHPVRAPATERLILFSLSAMVQYPLDVFKVRASSVFLHTICSFENASHIKSVVHWTHLIQFTSDSCLLFFVIILVLIFFLIDICANTDAPQGTVLAPFLFSLYTAECWSTDESCLSVKFADDEDTLYHRQVEKFVNWCDKNCLYWNFSKKVFF